MWIQYTSKNIAIKNTKHMSALDFAALFCNYEVTKMFVCWKIEMSKTQAFPAGKLECINTVSTS
jgi:hypothetical protein